MYVALLVGCLSATAPDPKKCMAVSSPRFFYTVEECEKDAVEGGQAFLYRRGLHAVEIKCVPVAVFGDGDT